MLLRSIVVIAFTVAMGLPATAQQPYCENVVSPVAFQPQGAWTIESVAAKSEVPVTTRSATSGLIGSRIIINGTHAEIRTKKNQLWKKIFATPVLGQQTYDTRSKEFWLDFRTAPNSLSLARYVNATDIEIGTVVASGKDQVYLNFSGIWFTLTRENNNQSL